MTLNATWVAIDIPRRPVTRRQAPATRPNANRPGYSTGRKWMTANHAEAASQASDVVEAGGERALQQAAVDELLDDRRADADHQHEQHHRAAARPVDELLGGLRQPVVGERVRPDAAQRQVDERDEHELGEHADRHADEVDGAEADGVVLDDVAAARTAATPPTSRRGRRSTSPTTAANSVGIGTSSAVSAPDAARIERGDDLADEEGGDPRDDRDGDVDGAPGLAQRTFASDRPAPRHAKSVTGLTASRTQRVPHVGGSRGWFANLDVRQALSVESR